MIFAPFMCEKANSRKPSMLWLKAPAKVNIYLEVLGRRDNGYHDIRSLVVPVSLYDFVSIEKLDGGAVEVDVENGPGMGREISYWSGEKDNIAVKAVELFMKCTRYSGGVRVQIKKNIPVGGGLGGGSADAAAVLIGLNEICGTGLSRGKLAEIGFKLGSDVPAMVHGGPVCMEGLGEKITVIDLKDGKIRPELWVIIVNPGFRVSTRDIYSRYISPLTFAEIPFISVVSSLKDGDVDVVARGLFNGLQETVFRKYPLIEIIVEELKKAGSIGALLCGSGASVFGLARDEKSAVKIAENMANALGFPVMSKAARILPDGVTVAHGPLEA